jgi:UDP-3-O-[3-hydroxymyristoyl] glucosamine N-acyltransferase
MIDPRFYLLQGPLSAAALFPGAAVEGDGETRVSSVAALVAAGPDALAFWDGPGWPEDRVAVPLGILVARPGATVPAGVAAAVIRAGAPRAAFSAAARKLYQERPAWSPEAAIAPDARIETGAVIAPGVVIGPGAEIGAGAEIGPGAVIGAGVTVGRRSQIGARAVIAFALVGDDVTIHPGAVIGAPGFGVGAGPSGPVDLVQLGRAIIQDRATIGALTTIDRGALGDTIVGEDAKIDNHCHVAHNAIVGRGVVMAAYAGVSGSAVIGEGAQFGGRVGVSDHVRIGAGARIAAGAAVLSDVPAGETWSGYPAEPHAKWLRAVAWLRKASQTRTSSGKAS